MRVCAGDTSSKGTVSSVPEWFRADSGTNLIKQEGILTYLACGSVAQWSECSHRMRENARNGVREDTGSGPGRFFFR